MTEQETWLRRALFFGDSFVAGVGDPTALGWVGRLVAASFARGVGLTAYNLGVRLDTSLDVRDRWLPEVERRLLAGPRSRLVFSFGANDTTTAGDGTRVSREQSTRALDAILRGAADHALTAFVVGPPPAGDDEQHARIRALSRDLAATCDTHHVPFIEVADRLGPGSAWMRQARGGDGAHPAAEGLAGRVTCTGWLSADA